MVDLSMEALVLKALEMYGWQGVLAVGAVKIGWEWIKLKIRKGQDDNSGTAKLVE